MTILAAAYSRSGTFVGCDTLVSSSVRTQTRTKIRRIGSWLVGACGPLLWDSYHPEPFRDPEEFADGWRDWAAERGHGETSDGQRLLAGAWMLVQPRRVVIVGSDGGVQRITERYAALGSGVEVGTGALAVAADLGIGPEAAVRLAVRAAIKHAEGCGGRVVVREVG